MSVEENIIPSSHEPSKVTESLLRSVGLQPSSCDRATVRNGCLFNIDMDKVLSTDVTPKDLRLIMENLDEPVVILNEHDSGLLAKRSKEKALSQRDLVTVTSWVIVPQKMVRMGELSPGVYFASGPDTRTPNLNSIQLEMGGGFEVNGLPAGNLRKALDRYMKEKRPSHLFSIVRRLMRGRTADTVAAREIGKNDMVGFSADSLTPALLCKIMDLYAQIVPGADKNLITSGSGMDSLRRAISTAIDPLGGIAPRYGSDFSKNSKMKMVEIGRSEKYDPLYTFVFNPNMDSPAEEKSQKVQEVVGTFSQAVRQLLVDWNIAQKARKLPGAD